MYSLELGMNCPCCSGWKSGYGVVLPQTSLAKALTYNHTTSNAIPLLRYTFPREAAFKDEDYARAAYLRCVARTLR